VRYLIVRGLLLLYTCLIFAPPVAFSAEGDAIEGDVETVLSTLNETLIENRALRAKAKELQSVVDNAAVERNVLESQIRRAGREEKRGGERHKNEVANLQRKIDDLKEKLKLLASTDEERLAEQQSVAEQTAMVQGENEKLRELLDGAIFKDEREKYKKLIKQASKDGKQAVKMIRSEARENERFRKELAHAHYDLGNVMYQSRDYERAITHYNRTLALDPTESWAHHNLGVIYDYYLQNDRAATYHYREYLKLKPIEEEAGHVRERLLDRELGQFKIPTQPLKYEHHKDDARTYQYRQGVEAGF
jgi:tetratricopeptide (TPR) repeat protein